MFGWVRRLIGGKDTREIEERLDEMEKIMRGLEEDWTDVYGKFRVLQMRVAKQGQRLDANSSPEESEGVDSGAQVPGVREGAGLTLSPHQREVRKQIMARQQRAASGAA